MGSVARGKAWLTLVCALFELLVVGRLLYDVKDGDGELGFGQGEGLGVGRRGVRLRSPRHGTVCVRAGAGTGGAVGVDSGTRPHHGSTRCDVSGGELETHLASLCMHMHVLCRSVGGRRFRLVLALSARGTQRVRLWDVQISYRVAYTRSHLYPHPGHSRLSHVSSDLGSHSAFRCVWSVV